jgi:hypothetical protein
MLHRFQGNGDRRLAMCFRCFFFREYAVIDSNDGFAATQ